MKVTMRKQFLRLILAVCFVFSGIGFVECTDCPISTIIVAHANGAGGTGTDTSNSTDSDGKGITGDENATLNITLDKDGNLTGGIAGNEGGTTGTVDTGNKILETLALVFTIVLAAASIILGIIFVLHCVSLAKDGNNPQGKSASITGLIMTAVAAVLCGGVGVFLGMFFNVFR